MKVKITRITPVYPGAVFIQWDVTPDATVSGKFAFEVFRSGSPGGEWVKIATVIDATNTLDDMHAEEHRDGAQLESITRSLYYKVTCVDPAGTFAESLPADLYGRVPQDDKQTDQLGPGVRLEKRKFLLRRKIIRDQTITLRSLNGVKIAVLKRRHFGTRCTYCFDPLTKLNTASRCTKCFGTGWVGGFYPPIFTYARFAASGTQTSLAVEGASDMNQNGVTLLNYPLVEEGDILVEPETDVRWRVAYANPTHLRQLVVHQRITAVELPRSSAEYKVVVEET